MPINAYTKNIIMPRATPRLDNPQAVQNAGSIARGFGQVADIGAQYAQKEYEAKQKVALNDSVITYKKTMMDLDEQMRQENMSTPDKYAERFQKESLEVAKAFEKSIEDSDTRQAFKMTRQQFDLGVYQSNLNWQNERNVSLMAESLEKAQGNLEVMAARGGNVDSLINDMRASAVAAEGIIAPEKINDFFDAGSFAIVSAKFDSLIDQGKTGEAKAMLDSNKYDDFLGGDGINKGYKAISAKNKQMQSEFKAEQTKALKQEYSNFNDAFDLGVIPPSESISIMKDRARTVGMDDVIKDINMKLNTHSEVNAFVKDLNISEQQSLMTQKMENLRNNPSEENIFEYKSLVKAYDTKVIKLQAGDGMSYYESIGLIPKQEQIDVTQPDNIIDVYESRRVAQQAITDREGVVVPLFTKAEAQNMSQHYNSLSVKERLNYITTITGGLTPPESSQLASVVAKDQPALAGILALSKENPRIAEKAIKGSMLENKVSSKSDVYSRLLKKIGNAVDDPELLNSSMDVIRDAYEQSLVENGKQVDEFGILDDVIEETFGEVISFGNPIFAGIGGINSNVLPYRKENGQFITSLEFRQKLDYIDINLLNTKQGSVPHINGKPITDSELEEIKYDWSMVTVGDGLYQVRNGNDVLVGENGSPYEFNMPLLTGDINVDSLVNRAVEIIGKKAQKSIQPLFEE